MSILGTDISAPVVRLAEAAVYNSAHLEHIEPALVEKYFARDDDGQWTVAHDIRRMCLFRRLNLISAPYPFQQRFQVVFCRNVLYYFEVATQLQVVESIYDVTEPGGFLITSVTDSLRGLNTRWAMVHSGVYRRTR